MNFINKKDPDEVSEGNRKSRKPYCHLENTEKVS